MVERQGRSEGGGEDGGVMRRFSAVNRALICASGALLLGLGPSPVQAEGKPRIELGLRFEQLHIDEGVQFSCDCDTDVDPDCERVDDPAFCAAASLDEAYDGFLVGAFAGGYGTTEWFAGGIRLALGVGSFDPSKDPKDGVDRSITLAHVTFEVPIEAHVKMTSMEFYVQVVPRVGLLNYIASASQDTTEESADTFTFGALFNAGFRFGGDDATQVRVGGGAVTHPGFRGWMVEAAVSPNIRTDNTEETDGAPLVYPDAPVEAGQSGTAPAYTSPTVGSDGFATPAAGPAVGSDGFAVPAKTDPEPTPEPETAPTPDATPESAPGPSPDAVPPSDAAPETAPTPET